MSDERFSLGYAYLTEVELSQLVPLAQDGKPLVAQKVFLDYTDISYIDSGSMELVVENYRNGREVNHSIKSDFGKPLGSLNSVTDGVGYEVYTETGRRHVGTRGRTENIKVKIRSASALPVRISSVEQTGTNLAES